MVIDCKKDMSGAAIVCVHVAKKNYPILMARRDEPVSDVDSGWQFLCNSGADENMEEAQTWSINEVIRIEPSLQRYLAHPEGTTIFRKGKDTEWIVK